MADHIVITGDSYTAWEKENWIEPEIDETFGPDRTALTLSFVSRTTQCTNQLTTQTTQSTTQSMVPSDPKDSVYALLETELSIISLLKKYPEYSQTSVARELDMDINLVKYYVRKLKEKNLLSRKGSSRTGTWIVKV